MIDNLVQWATLLSPIISVIAIIVALHVARSSSKDAQKQIAAIRHLLDVFVAANNLDIVEAQRKYQQQLVELDKEIEDAQMEIDTVYPFVGGARIDHIIAAQEKAEQKAHLDQLLAKRREIEVNQNLEAMAKQLYDYWFVQFDFPNEEGKPYKSSGEVMVYNERFGREIPQRWSTMPISEILDKYPTTKRYETKEYLSCGKYPIIDQGDSYIVGFTNEVDHLLTRHPAVLFGDHSTKVKFLDFDFARGADGTQILYSSNEAVSQYYLYLAVSALQIRNLGYSRHFKYLKELPIIIPDLKIANKFKNIVKPLFEEWTKNIFCNIELTKQRNELLPLLMNGQVSVNSDLSVCINLIIRTTTRICSYPNDLFWSYLRIVFL